MRKLSFFKDDLIDISETSTRYVESPWNEISLFQKYKLPIICLDARNKGDQLAWTFKWLIKLLREQGIACTEKDAILMSKVYFNRKLNIAAQSLSKLDITAQQYREAVEQLLEEHARL